MQKSYTVKAAALVEAPADVVYAILADYRDGHEHILPRRYFTSLTVEQGGTGEGTIIRFGMRAFGKTRESRAAVTEPEPGRVLVETVLDGADVVTTFIVEPEGRQSRVTISTELRAAAGLRGALGRIVTRRFLKRVYAAELEQLNDLASRRRSRLTIAAWCSAIG